VLRAVNPLYTISFLTHHMSQGFIVLSGVFLVLTGAEALYADMGHFGPKPIRIGWIAVLWSRRALAS
jgi:KUP system potassium uptake protein